MWNDGIPSIVHVTVCRVPIAFMSSPGTLPSALMCAQARSYGVMGVAGALLVRPGTSTWRLARANARPRGAPFFPQKMTIWVR